MKKILNKILTEYKKNEGNIISLLQVIQDEFGYIPEEAVQWSSLNLDIPESKFYGIATFYAQFKLHPSGKHLIRVCRGTACHVKGSARISEELQKTLKVKVGITTEDKMFTFEHVACVGACARAPIFLVNDNVYGMSTPEKAKKLIKGMKSDKKA
jgi:NADH-quinone oxidoreductase subunit E